MARYQCRTREAQRLVTDGLLSWIEIYPVDGVYYRNIAEAIGLNDYGKL